MSQFNIAIEAAALKSATQNAERIVAKLRKKHQWTIKSLIKLVRVFSDSIEIQIDGKTLSDLLVKARDWWTRLSDGKVNIATLAREEGITASWITRVVRLNFLSPQIIDAILAGKQPAALAPKRLTNAGQLPFRWDDQASSLLR